MKKSIETYTHIRVQRRDRTKPVETSYPRFMIGQKVWKHFANDVKTRTIKCPVCKERHVERKTTPIVAYCTIKEVRLFVTDATVKAMYVLDDDRTANEDQLFPTYDEALKDALAEIEIMGKVVAKRIAQVKEGIRKYKLRQAPVRMYRFPLTHVIKKNIKGGTRGTRVGTKHRP